MKLSDRISTYIDKKPGAGRAVSGRAVLISWRADALALEAENERLREANRVGRDHLRELGVQNEALMKIATTRPHYVVINPRPEPDKTAYFWLGREADRG